MYWFDAKRPPHPSPAATVGAGLFPAEARVDGTARRLGFERQRLSSFGSSLTSSAAYESRVAERSSTSRGWELEAYIAATPMLYTEILMRWDLGCFITSADGHGRMGAWAGTAVWMKRTG